MKICTKCKESKNICDFPGDNSKPDGHRARCKSCEREVRRNRAKSVPKKPRIMRHEPRKSAIVSSNAGNPPPLPCEPDSAEMKMRAAAAASAIGYY